MNKYLVDTSVWIAFFRLQSPIIKKRMFQLLDDNRIATNGIILAELLIGAASKKESHFIEENFKGLHFLEADYSFFVKAGQTGQHLRQQGLNIPLSDIAIAAHAKIHHLTVLTCDRHFEEAGRRLNVEYEILENFGSTSKSTKL